MKQQLYKKIVLGYDGSENAERALSRAIEISSMFNSELFIVTAVDSVMVAAYTSPEAYAKLLADLQDRAKQALDRSLEKARLYGCNVNGSVVENHPSDAILDKAREVGADLIVVGRRGMRGLKRILIGSVSSAVVSNSECDVLVVK